MASKKDTDIKAPLGTPVWSIGLTFLLVSVLGAMVTFYLAIKPEVESYLRTSQENQRNQMDLDFKRFNLEVTSRVSHLERDVAELKTKLSSCQKRLELCEKIKK